MLYKNFGKRAKDCGDVYSSVERTAKLSSKAADGTKFEMTQQHRVEKDGNLPAGQFSTFVTKFGKRKGFNIDEFSVSRKKTEDSADEGSATAKYSLSGVVPDGKLKGSVAADLLTGNFKNVKVGFEYAKGPLALSGDVSTKLKGRDFFFIGDAVFAKGPCSVGVRGTAAVGGKPDVDVSFQYSMGKDTTFCVQTLNGFSRHKASVHRQMSSKLELAALVLHNNAGKKPEDTVAETCGTYNIDHTSSLAFNFDLGSVVEPNPANMTLAATYTNQVRSYAALNFSAAVPFGGTMTPKFGWNVEIN